MTKRDSGSLEDPASWDADRAERHPPARRRRAILSVAFEPAELEQIAARAERDGKRLTDFVREAALEKAASAVGAYTSTEAIPRGA